MARRTVPTANNLIQYRNTRSIYVLQKQVDRLEVPNQAYFGT